MKKSTIVIIGIVYLASIIFINFFGMKYSVYNEFVPVLEIVCRNESDDKVTVSSTSSGKKLIATKFIKPANKEDISGTMIQLFWKVAPDNATLKDVEFIYDKSNANVEFYKTEDGEDTGLVLFYDKTMINVQIVARDDRGAISEVTLWAY